MSMYRQCSSLSHALFGLVMCTLCNMSAGCIFLPQGGGDEPSSVCDVSQKCDEGDPMVCGEDGQIYACEAFARCLAVVIDGAGETCSANMCDPSTCSGVTCSNGFLKDENGCDHPSCVCEGDGRCAEDAHCALNEGCVQVSQIGPGECQPLVTCTPPGLDCAMKVQGTLCRQPMRWDCCREGDSSEECTAGSKPQCSFLCLSATP